MKKILLILLVAFILIQFFQIDKNNPAPTPQLDFLKIKDTPESTANLIRNGCYDCHSNESKYPWYANLQPVGWFLKDHIEEGRKELNFSTFATNPAKRQAHKLSEVQEMIENGKMPLDSYVLGHPEAKFSAAQKQEIIQYFKLIEADIRRSHNLPPDAKKK
ncbi:heme-binding domain-containing protein [Kaistella palustris]|uniref:heme-binding domain-containing protein n=1 Tax=Kaistella palustris TaxID=493376 RepID=UPI0003F6D009|nr:heme-binding domain-containing protein [Kaistella palustris]